MAKRPRRKTRNSVYLSVALAWSAYPIESRQAARTGYTLSTWRRRKPQISAKRLLLKETIPSSFSLRKQSLNRLQEFIEVERFFEEGNAALSQGIPWRGIRTHHHGRNCF